MTQLSKTRDYFRRFARATDKQNEKHQTETVRAESRVMPQHLKRATGSWHSTLCKAAASLVMHRGTSPPSLPCTMISIRLTTDGNQDPSRLVASSARCFAAT